MEVGRFAPSTTGRAHPGTLLAAMLSWLDARARGARFVLRLEDLDPARVRREYTEALAADLEWLGLDWDVLELQSAHGPAHEAALDALARAGALYECSCSRAQLKALGVRAPDGGFAYSNRCRDRGLPVEGWRASRLALRARLPDGMLALTDEGGESLSQDAAAVMGDPVVRRRDGAISYQLAVVVDDARAGVTRVVRGRDIAPSTATQVRLQGLLGLPRPTYRHHFLFLEPHGDKLAKLHGSVAIDALRTRYSAPELTGRLAWLTGLADDDLPRTPRSLIGTFAWERVRRADRVVTWDGVALAPG